MEVIKWLLDFPEFRDEVQLKIRRALTGRSVESPGPGTERRNGTIVDFEADGPVRFQAGRQAGRSCRIAWECEGWITAGDGCGTFRRRAWPQGSVEVTFPELGEDESLVAAWPRTGRDLTLDRTGMEP